MRFYVWLGAILIGIFLVLIYYKGAASLGQIISTAVQNIIALLQGRNPKTFAQTAYPS